MTRKLLPYEYELIQTLGVSKEEYLEFLAVQQQYTDVKVGTNLDIRNDPGTQALVLTIVGVLFQVAAALLAPRPVIPEADRGEGQAQTRDQRLAPRFGFNSVQELAKYGDIVPLIYTDTSTNTAGGVRVATTLLWSAIKSFGNNQFLQAMMLLGGGGTTAINIGKCAFGQSSIEDLVAQNKWIYFKPGDTGTLRFDAEQSSNTSEDPTRYGDLTSNPYSISLADNNVPLVGFSQAITPSSTNVFGGYSPVPFAVYFYLRDGNGDKYGEPVDIYLQTSFSYASNGFSRPLTNSDTLGFIPVGATVRVWVRDTLVDQNLTDFNAEFADAKADARRGLATYFDDGGIFKLGSALFRVIRVQGNSTDENNVFIDLTCIESGNAPSVPYNKEDQPPVFSSDYIVRYDNFPVSSFNYIFATDTAAGKLFHGQSITSSNGWYRLIMQTDGNLVIYNKANVAVWNTGTYDTNAYYAHFQADGNLVLYTVTNDVIWYSNHNTYDGSSAYIWRLENTGELVLYDTNNVSLWRSHLGTDVEPTETVSTQVGDAVFYRSKALVRVEKASYTSATVCNVVDFALRCTLFRNISGRQRVYGSEQRAGYSAADNGTHQRASLFLVKYRVDKGTWRYVNGIFVVRRANELENYVYLKFSSSTAYNWEFEFEPVIDPFSEITKNAELRVSGGALNYLYLENNGVTFNTTITTGIEMTFTGYSKQAFSNNYLPPVNKSPDGTSEWDWFSLDADTNYRTSFDNGPELALAAVTEQQLNTFDTTKLYKNLSLIGLNVFSGKSLQDMRSFTAFVTQGRAVRRLNTSTLTYPSSPDGPSCYAPDIFLDTVIDSIDGIGNFAELQGVDTRQLAITKRFCVANNLFFDGIIADQRNWRTFWVDVAPFSLLEFARIGGRETLVPAVPYNQTTGQMDRTVNISALFNQGNILEDSFKEEFVDYDANVQDVLATIVYRSLDVKGLFAQTKSVVVQRSDTVEATAISQTFDLSTYVTNEAQAILFGKLVCNLRRYVKSNIEFKTFPTNSPVAPGSFIYVDMGLNQWDGIYTGVVGPNGQLNMPIADVALNGTYSILLYRSGDDVVKTSVSISNNVASGLSSREGWLFVLGQNVTSKRVYRVGEVDMSTEGEVTIRATEYPCDSQDRSLIADFSDSLFTVRR